MEFHGKIYKGYHLTDIESSLFSFIGIHKKGSLTSIAAQRQLLEFLDFVEYTWSEKKAYHCYSEWFGAHSRF